MTYKNKICLIVDDIVDTGGTINNAVDALFKKGAKEVLELAKKLNIKKAILKARSPSCGVRKNL